MPEPDLVHLYPGPSHHLEGFVVGNRGGLLALRAALDAALAGGADHNAAAAKAFVADGEGYTLVVVRQDTPWGGPAWRALATPYTDEDARPAPDAGSPYELLTPATRRVARGPYTAGPSVPTPPEEELP